MPRMSKGMILLLCCAVPVIPSAAQDPDKNSEKPIAEVGGKPIYEHDIASKMHSRLIQLARQEYEITKGTLDSYINDELVAQQAKAQGLTSEAFLQREVEAKIPQPTDGEVRAYYVAQQNLQGRPFDEMKEQLRGALRQTLIARARKDYIDGLRAKANVQVLLEPPRLQVSYDSARLRGDPHAPVTMVEFSDFQCPYCRSAEPTLRQLFAKYSGKLSLAYRDFPLRQIHPLAEKAAEASRCAEEQGKFWEYHDLLLNDPPKLDTDSLMADARSLHLDEKQFDSCFSGGKYAAAIQSDEEAGTGLGVSGTPGFFINGVFVNGIQSAEAFERVIDQELAALQRRQVAGARK